MPEFWQAALSALPGVLASVVVSGLLTRSPDYGPVKTMPDALCADLWRRHYKGYFPWPAEPHHVNANIKVSH